MKLGWLALRWFGREGWFIRVGRVSLAWIPNPVERDFRPLSERYGTGRTWGLGPLRLRYHGRLHRRHRGLA